MPMPCTESWNDCAVPWNDVVIVSGILRFATAPLTPATASESDMPGARLNDTVTAGTWPKWLIVAAPTECPNCVTAESGTSCVDDGSIAPDVSTFGGLPVM